MPNLEIPKWTQTGQKEEVKVQRQKTTEKMPSGIGKIFEQQVVPKKENCWAYFAKV